MQPSQTGQLMRMKSIPVFEYWFESHTKGLRPVKIPVPPRIWVVRSSSSAALKPSRGDHMTFPLGTSLVLRPGKVAAKLGFSSGAPGIAMMSARRPSVTLKRSLSSIRSWA